ncbi:MAG: aminopeptidase P family protein [Roseobacter sp.]
MFQSFEVTARPEQGPPRLAALRKALKNQALDGFLVPRADAHQGEYVAPCDERLAWLTGFTGSAGFCAVLSEIAGVFIDGRYRTQVKAQVAAEYTPVPWPDVSLGDWLKKQLPDGGKVGFDPWLHTVKELDDLNNILQGTDIQMCPCDNLVDQIWSDRPAAPSALAKIHPLEFAGESHADKRQRLGIELQSKGQKAALITLPDSLCWLLNIRGADIPRNPVAQGFCLLEANGDVQLFMDADKLEGLQDHLGRDVVQHAPSDLIAFLEKYTGPVRMDKGTVPVRLANALGAQGVWGGDPCALPKARKNQAEIDGSAAAHLRDGAAVVELLAWLDAQEPGSLTETQVVTKLEGFRRRDNALQDISFETIAGTGPNGAIMHYRVTEETDSQLEDGQIIVLDSGGQYLDGTTDITRTIAIGQPSTEATEAFTRVLQGMIAMSRLRWPQGLAGRDIEGIARLPLWMAGQDFNHGLGHGVGAYLSVHEGPQRLSRASHVPLEPGMILSNEPGYYREGAFGIRIENLIVVIQAPELATADPEREMLAWRTLTFVPIDRRLILAERLTGEDRNWLNAYHREVAEKIMPRVSPSAQTWLEQATAPV